MSFVRAIAGAKNKMGMIRQKSPGITGYLTCGQQYLQPFNKILTIIVIAENISPFNPPYHHMVKYTGCV
jgi:hypothetical protein